MIMSRQACQHCGLGPNRPLKTENGKLVVEYSIIRYYKQMDKKNKREMTLVVAQPPYSNSRHVE